MNGKFILFEDLLAGEPERCAVQRDLLHRIGRSERMLLQVEQYGGTETYEYDLRRYGEAVSWLAKQCAKKRK